MLSLVNNYFCRIVCAVALKGGIGVGLSDSDARNATVERGVLIARRVKVNIEHVAGASLGI
jgi:hypothetical protein